MTWKRRVGIENATLLRKATHLLFKKNAVEGFAILGSLSPFSSAGFVAQQLLSSDLQVSKCRVTKKERKKNKRGNGPIRAFDLRKEESEARTQRGVGCNTKRRGYGLDSK